MRLVVPLGLTLADEETHCAWPEYSLRCQITRSVVSSEKYGIKLVLLNICFRKVFLERTLQLYRRVVDAADVFSRTLLHLLVVWNGLHRCRDVRTLCGWMMCKRHAGLQVLHRRSVELVVARLVLSP